MAPITMPKLRPSPARIGIRSESTSSPLRAKRASSSRSRNSGEMRAAKAPSTQSSRNSTGTATRARPTPPTGRRLRGAAAPGLTAGDAGAPLVGAVTSAVSPARERIQDHAVLDHETRRLGDVAADHLARDGQRDGQDRLEQERADD